MGVGRGKYTHLTWGWGRSLSPLPPRLCLLVAWHSTGGTPCVQSLHPEVPLFALDSPVLPHLPVQPPRFPLSFLPLTWPVQLCCPQGALSAAVLASTSRPDLCRAAPEYSPLPGHVVHAQAQGTVLGFMLCSYHLEIHNGFCMRSSRFHFPVGPTNYEWSQSCLRAQKPTKGSEGTERYQNSQEGRGDRQGGLDMPSQMRRKRAGEQLGSWGVDSWGQVSQVILSDRRGGSLQAWTLQLSLSLCLPAGYSLPRWAAKGARVAAVRETCCLTCF